MHTTDFCIGVMQRDYACNVEAAEIQAHISDGNSLCADSYPTISHFCLLGIWRHASQPFQCLFSATKVWIQGHGSYSYAHSSGERSQTQFTVPCRS